MPTITLTTLQFPPSPTRIGEVRKAESEKCEIQRTSDNCYTRLIRRVYHKQKVQQCERIHRLQKSTYDISQNL